MRTITIGAAEQRIVVKVLRDVAAGRPAPRLNAAEAAALRTFLARQSWAETVGGGGNSVAASRETDVPTTRKRAAR